MTKKDEILHKVISTINKADPDSEVYLYGSRARGDSKQTSDWDLLILLNLGRISFDYETAIMNKFYDLEIETGEVFSPLIYSKNDWVENHSFTPLYENIKKEGVRLK
jgi:predicted nucleotidyltransferase